MDKNEVEVDEVLDLPEIPEGEEDTTDWKAEALKLQGKAGKQREKTQILKKEKADLEIKVAELSKPSIEKQTPPKTGELDETQLDYLDVKGITESEDVKVIEDIVKKTGMTVRQALKDDYVVKKLESLKAAREVKDATPSSTRRTGAGQSDDLALGIAKYEQSGFDAKTLPDDFALRSKIINAVAAKQNTNKPAWH